MKRRLLSAIVRAGYGIMHVAGAVDHGPRPPALQRTHLRPRWPCPARPVTRPHECNCQCSASPRMWLCQRTSGRTQARGCGRTQAACERVHGPEEVSLQGQMRESSSTWEPSCGMHEHSSGRGRVPHTGDHRPCATSGSAGETAAASHGGACGACVPCEECAPGAMHNHSVPGSVARGRESERVSRWRPP